MHASFSKRKEYYVEFLSMFECPFTKSTSSSSFGNGMDIEISQKTKIWKKYFYAVHIVSWCKTSKDNVFISIHIILDFYNNFSAVYFAYLIR